MWLYYAFPPFRLAEFLLGIVLAVIWKRKLIEPRLSLLCLSGFAFVASCFAGLTTNNLAILNATAVPFILAIIYYSAEKRPAWLEWKPLVYLGDVSYGNIHIWLRHNPDAAVADAAPRLRSYGGPRRRAIMHAGACCDQLPCSRTSCPRVRTKPHIADIKSSGRIAHASTVHMIKLTESHEITPYKWAHPDEERSEGGPQSFQKRSEVSHLRTGTSMPFWSRGVAQRCIDFLGPDAGRQ
jgi:hypothetical protein